MMPVDLAEYLDLPLITQAIIIALPLEHPKFGIARILDTIMLTRHNNSSQSVSVHLSVDTIPGGYKPGLVISYNGTISISSFVSKPHNLTQPKWRYVSSRSTYLSAAQFEPIQFNEILTECYAQIDRIARAIRTVRNMKPARLRRLK